LKSLRGDILWSEEILKAGKPLRIGAEGNSMFPAIRSRDTIIIAPRSGEEPNIGEIIIYREGMLLVAHRLIEKRWENGVRILITKGDYHRNPDDPITILQLLGKVIRIERGKRIFRMEAPSSWFRNRMLAWLSARSPFYLLSHLLEKIHYLGRKMNDGWWWLRERWEKPPQPPDAMISMEQENKR
jgi:signal peptidase I